MSDERSRRRQGGRGEARRLIAGLRITRQDEALLDVVRPLFPEADSEGELAYRLWRRGLELTLAEGAGLGATLPAHSSEELIASLVVQRLLLCMPLLRRTQKLALLGLEETSSLVRSVGAPAVPLTVTDTETIDASASDAIADLGGSNFL
jgi:hypothetical protein